MEDMTKGLAKGAIEGTGKRTMSLIFASIVFLILIIFSGRILSLINKSSCKTDKDIQGAHKWAGAAVGISTAGLIICLGFLIAMYAM